MNITQTRMEDTIQLSVEGRIDVNSAPMLQAEILKTFQKTNRVVVNFSGSDYISSAGLRALLIGQRTAQSKGGFLRLVNMCDTMTNTLKLSGMDKILDVE